MTDQQPTDTLLNYLHQHGLTLDDEYMRVALRTMMQSLMELEVGALTGADLHERRDERQTYRNGYRTRRWSTSSGVIRLEIPKLRKGTYYPGFIASPQQTEQILRDLALNAFIEGVEINKARDALTHLGLSDMQSRNLIDICERLDDIVREFRQQPLEDVYRELHLDILDVRIEKRGRHVDRLMVTGIGTKLSGERELLAHEIVTGIDERFWNDFLHDLQRRGARSVKRVTSPADYRVRYAVEEVLTDAAWQPIRAYSMVGISEWMLPEGWELEMNDFSWLMMAA